MKTVLLVVLLSLSVLGGGYWWWHQEEKMSPSDVPVVAPPNTAAIEEKDTKAPEAPTVEQEPITPVVTRDPLKTSFVLQAPDGEWSNPLFENACEEASMLMVSYLLADQEKVTSKETKSALLKVIAYEEKRFGHAFDTGAEDTAKILTEYFGIKNEVRRLETEADMRVILEQGNILILPTDGRKLGNPFFKAPGPETHMLVVLKYDAKAEEYIVHDPGTKRGAFYHYQPKVLWGALEDYPTGAKHLPKSKKEKKVIIVSLENEKATP